MTTGFNIASHFHAAAGRVPHRLAIADVRGEITFGDLQRAVIQQVAIFQKQGLQPGDRVLVFVPMGIDLYIHVLALFHMGCTAVFLDEWVNIKRLQLCCEIANCKGFIGTPLARFVGRFIPELRAIPVWIKGKTNFAQTTTQNTAHHNPIQHSPFDINAQSDTALITFTTGSTGTPKAAKRTHAFLDAQFSALKDTLNAHDALIDMPALPIVLLINLGLGIPSIVPNWKASKPNKIKPKNIIAQWEKYGVNRLIASPYFVEAMAKSQINQPNQYLDIEQIFSGGAPVFPDSATLWCNAFPNSQIQVVFGSTEAEPIAKIDAKDLKQCNVPSNQGLCVGDISPWTEVLILPISDQAMVAESDQDMVQMALEELQVGEIVVRGEHVLREYFNNPEALLKNKIFYQNQCWHRTGDAGFIGTDKKLYLLGRTQQIFHHEGQDIYPFLEEYKIKQIEGVAMGTLLKINDKVVYFIELIDPKFKSHVDLFIRCNSPKPDWVVYKPIPRDKRHHTKIDYDRLVFHPNIE